MRTTEIRRENQGYVSPLTDKSWDRAVNTIEARDPTIDTSPAKTGKTEALVPEVALARLAVVRRRADEVKVLQRNESDLQQELIRDQQMARADLRRHQQNRLTSP